MSKLVAFVHTCVFVCKITGTEMVFVVSVLNFVDIYVIGLCTVPRSHLMCSLVYERTCFVYLIVLLSSDNC
jgi:hypothetical protein